MRCPSRGANRAVVFQLRSRFAAFFEEGNQFGVAVEGGAEIVAHAVRSLLDSSPHHSVLSLDCANAFNTVSREAIRDRLAVHFPVLLGAFDRFYMGAPAKLLLDRSSGLAEEIPADSAMELDFSPRCAPDGTHQAIILSQRGVHQGDPLAPVFFAFGIYQVIQMLQDEHPDCSFWAYLDDINIVGPMESLGLFKASNSSAGVFQSAQDLLILVHLVLQHTKCIIHSPAWRPTPPDLPPNTLASDPGDWFDQSMVAREGIVILGVAMGTDTFVLAHLDSTFESASGLMDIIHQLDSPQVKMLLLRYCVASRATFAVRVGLPTLTGTFSTRFDDLVVESFWQILDLNPLSELRSRVLSPLRYGGFGFQPLATIRHIQFACSLHFAVGNLRLKHDRVWRWRPLEAIRLFPGAGMCAIPSDVHVSVQPGAGTTFVERDASPLWGAHWGAMDRIVALYQAAIDLGIVSLRDPSQDSFPLDLKQAGSWDDLSGLSCSGLSDLAAKIALHDHLQPAPSVAHQLEGYESLASLPRSDTSRALIRSAAGPYASRFLEAIPFCRMLVLEPHVFRTLCCMRLGIDGRPGDSAQLRSSCAFCQHQLRPNRVLNHFSSCVKNGGRGILRHDRVVAALRSCARATEACSTSREPPLPSVSGRHNRADIEFLPLHCSDRRWLVDVVVVNPGADSRASACADTSSFAVAQAEAGKLRKHGDSARRSEVDFMPAGFETGGAWGKGAIKVLDRLTRIASSSTGAQGDTEVAHFQDFRRFWSTAISVALMAGVAHCALEGVSRAMCRWKGAMSDENSALRPWERAGLAGLQATTEFGDRPCTVEEQRSTH